MFNGKLIMYLRRQRKLSQQDVADKLNVTRGTISNWEIGKRVPDIANLVHISDFFGVSLDLFIERNPHEMKREICGQIEAFLLDKEISKELKENLYASICLLFEKKFKK